MESAKQGEDVLVELTETVARIVLNRPDSLNAVTLEMAHRIASALDEIEKKKSIRVVVFTGTGRAFCVGADLNSARQRSRNGAGDRNATRHFMQTFNDLLNRIESFPKPAITALNGMTMGAGLELALATDFIVASSAAKIGDGHAKFGLLPGGGASARLPRRIGPAAAKWMFFDGDFRDNDDLLRWGLLQAIYPEEDFEHSVEALCDRIASRSPIGLVRLKELANKASARSLDEALDAEQAMLMIHMTSKDRAEGLSAFAEKRKPIFTGE